jgi:hypothetical protein
MRKQWSVIVFLLLATSLTGGQTNPQSLGTGVIAGIVLNEHGQLVNQANACVSAISGHLRETNCNIRVDKDGAFEINSLKFGTYEVFAINQCRGYLIENQAPGKIRMAGNHPRTNVTIRLRPKWGTLERIGY